MDYKELYFCFSYNLKEFLSEKGIRYMITAKHNHTLKQFWLYKRSDELHTALDQYSVQKGSVNND